MLIPSSSSGGVSEFGDAAQAAGAATAPAAGSSFVSLPAASLPAGVYVVTCTFLISGAVDTSRPDNHRLYAGALGLLDLPTGTSQNVLIPGRLDRVTLDGATPLTQKVLSNASGGAIYTGSIQAVRVA